MFVNPLAPVIEFWLTFYNALPSPFRAYLNMCLGFLAITALISLVWRIK